MEGTMSEVFLLAVVVLFPLLALGLVVAFHRWLD
jgi:nitrate reductase NapE component